MRKSVGVRLFALTGALMLVLAGCAKRPPTPEELMAQLPAYGGGGMALIYPQLKERPLATQSAAGDTVVRVFRTQFYTTHIGRVERRKAGWMYVRKSHDGRNDAAPVTPDSVIIAPDLVHDLLATIRSSNIWRDSSATCTGTQIDGQSVTLEARVGAQYSTVKCRVSSAAPLPKGVEATLAAFGVIASQAPGRRM